MEYIRKKDLFLIYSKCTLNNDGMLFDKLVAGNCVKEATKMFVAMVWIMITKAC